jgi:hypothetical protein
MVNPATWCLWDGTRPISTPYVKFGGVSTRRSKTVGCFGSRCRHVNIISYLRAALALVFRLFLHLFPVDSHSFGLVLFPSFTETIWDGLILKNGSVTPPQSLKKTLTWPRVAQFGHLRGKPPTFATDLGLGCCTPNHYLCILPGNWTFNCPTSLPRRATTENRQIWVGRKDGFCLRG